MNNKNENSKKNNKKSQDRDIPPVIDLTEIDAEEAEESAIRKLFNRNKRL